MVECIRTKSVDCSTREVGLLRHNNCQDMTMIVSDGSGVRVSAYTHILPDELITLLYMTLLLLHICRPHHDSGFP